MILYGDRSQRLSFAPTASSGSLPALPLLYSGLDI